MQKIHDKGGAKPKNIGLNISNLTCDQYVGFINNYLLKDISGDIEVIIQNGNEVNKKYNKWGSSVNLNKTFAEVDHSKLKGEIITIIIMIKITIILIIIIIIIIITNDV